MIVLRVLLKNVKENVTDPSLFLDLLQHSTVPVFAARLIFPASVQSLSSDVIGPKSRA